MAHDEPSGKVELSVLVQMMSAQSVLRALPSVTKIVEFVLHALEVVPGVMTPVVCVRGVPALRSGQPRAVCLSCGESRRADGDHGPGSCGLVTIDGVVSLPLETLQSHYGYVILDVGQPEVFEPYRPFISNFANVVALAIENRRQEVLLRIANEELQARKNALEEQVAARTRELIETNDALTRSEALLRIAGRTARFGGWMADAVTMQTTWSDEVALIHELAPGYSPSVNEGISFYAPEWRDKIAQVFGACLRDGVPYDEELEIVTARGKRVWVRTAGEAMRDESGAIVRVQGSFQDIAERKAAERQQRELERNLQHARKTESLGRMAGAIAHQYNNLMTAVLGNLELALDDLPHGAPVVENLGEAARAARQAAEVSSLMLTYLGQSSGKRDTLDLSLVCGRTLGVLRTAAPTHVELVADLPTPGPVIHAVAHQTQQILANLVTNAWEALGDRPGAVHVTVKTVFPEEIPRAGRFSLDWQPQDQCHACLEVADAGCGIPQQDIENLFDPFFTTKFTGRGLGLPAALGITKAHHGGMTVESELGRGTIVRVFFPVSAQDQLPLSEGAAAILELEQGGTVLLIEDEQTVRRLARLMLERLGFEVLEAKDGVEAVGVFRGRMSEIRCVICDLTMPRMDGWETLVALRRLAPDVRVILASGYDQAQVMSGEHAEWPQAFLSKPYRVTDLRDTLASVMKHKSVVV